MTWFTIKFVFLIISLVLLQTEISKAIPRITYIPNDSVVDIGNNVDLQCTVENTDKMIVRWLKVQGENRPIILTEGNISRFPKFSIKYEKFTSTYTLQLKNFEISDEGYYQCVIVVSLTDRIVASSHLSARRTPHINHITEDFACREGENITLQCYAEGFPKPKITWWRHGYPASKSGAITLTENSILIPYVTLNNGGTFFCQAGNGPYQTNYRSVTVSVMFLPSITTPHTQLSRPLNSEVNLECRIHSFPLPKIIWKKSGQQLTNGTHGYKIFSIEYGKDSVTENLYIAHLRKDQLGSYTCIAINTIGKNEARINLTSTDSRLE